MKLSILIFAIFITSISSFSQDQIIEEKNKNDIKDETGSSKSNQNFAKRWWEASKNKVSTILDEGQNDFYLTLYAYHDRFTYTPEKLKDLNEGAYGLGFGKSKINEKGNTEMLYVMTHLDSHQDVQANIGYAWVKKFRVTENTKVGIGYTAGLVSRSDFAGRIPLPIALPLGTFDIGNVSLNAIFIPKLNDGINNGNVVFIFGKFTWESKSL